MIGSIAGRPVNFVQQPPRSGDVRDSLASLDRARRLLGYQPRISLDEGLRRIWAWLGNGSAAARRLDSEGVRRRTA